MEHSVINRYLISEFLKTVINMTLIFTAGGLIMNLEKK